MLNDATLNHFRRTLKAPPTSFPELIWVMRDYIHGGSLEELTQDLAAMCAIWCSGKEAEIITLPQIIEISEKKHEMRMQTEVIQERITEFRLLKNNNLGEIWKRKMDLREWER